MGLMAKSASSPLWLLLLEPAREIVESRWFRLEGKLNRRNGAGAGDWKIPSAAPPAPNSFPTSSPAAGHFTGANFLAVIISFGHVFPAMSENLARNPSAGPATATHHRRPRYAGRHPRRFEEKYKEHHPERYSDTVAKVLASGKTPAGTHRPIMVAEILEILAPKPGEVAVDCTLGYGGHAQELLERLRPNGRLIGLDIDP